MQFDRTTVFYLIVLVIIVLAASIITISVKKSAQMNMTGNDHPDSESILSTGGVSPYVNLVGDIVDLRPYSDEVLIVSAWATWCPTCANELKELSKLAREFNDKNVTIVAINRKENKEIARSFLDTVNISEQILVLLDPEDHFFRAVEGYAMPETIFYDRNGNIVSHQRTDMPFDKMRALTQKALGDQK